MFTDVEEGLSTFYSQRTVLPPAGGFSLKTAEQGDVTFSSQTQFLSLAHAAQGIVASGGSNLSEVSLN